MEAAENFAQGKSAMFVEAGGIGPVVEKEGNPVVGKVSYVALPHAEGKASIPSTTGIGWSVSLPPASRKTRVISSSSGQPARRWAFRWPRPAAHQRGLIWNSPEFLSWANPDWPRHQ